MCLAVKYRLFIYEQKNSRPPSLYHWFLITVKLEKTTVRTENPTILEVNKQSWKKYKWPNDDQ